jgi:hypothetical protein
MAKRRLKKERIVCISFWPDGSLRVEPESVKVRRGHLVRWITIVRDAKIEITFKRRIGSPFTGDAVSTLPHGQALSTAVRGDVKVGQKFPYSVVLAIGKHEVKLDPDVEIER